VSGINGVERNQPLPFRIKGETVQADNNLNKTWENDGLFDTADIWSCLRRGNSW
jgi:hypothetical protein